MSDEKRTVELNDEELENIVGGVDKPKTPTTPCYRGRMTCDPFWCRTCGYATDLETGVATSCTLGYPNAHSGVIPI